jgi:GntR family transcriptional regulator
VLRGKPFAVGSMYLDAGRARLTREQVDRNPTYSILEKLLHERIGRADVSIRYERASGELARALGLPKGAPLMVFERVSYSVAGVPLEHSLYYARAEAYEFSLTVRGKLPITRSLKAAG